MIKILCKKIPTPLTAEDIFTTVFEDSKNRVWLDSSSHTIEGKNERQRFSIMADDLGEDASIQHFSTGEIFNELNQKVPTHDVFVEHKDYECSFQLGWIGWISYEAEATFMHTDRALVLDHQTGDCFALFYNTQENTKWLMHVAQKISSVQETYLKHLGQAPVFRARDSKDSYLAKVEAILEEIRQGNTYEACLTTQLSAQTPEDFTALDTYLALRHNNKAPYNAFIQLDGTTLMSTSPERFLGITAEGKIIAEPIKGTRKRAKDATEDLEHREDLYSSLKDRAENMMIVDLMRNDLSHFAVPGTIKVDRLFDIESYQSVHQMVSTISAQLRKSAQRGDVIQAAFPAGSMTGAPKIKTMEILKELEAKPRGIYSGCLGFISHNGAVELSVIIRTLIEHQGTLSLGVGGAVVADSTPEAEYEEIQTKASGILDTLGSTF
ncbi:MAG: aminodeoxychorismate synthase component I [Micrococcaceae bacterium]